MKKRTVMMLVTGIVATSLMMQYSSSDSISENVLQRLSQNVDATDLLNKEETNNLAKYFNEELKEENAEFVKATLVRVVDGDTIVVDIDGTEAKVRLIGINTPESVAPDSYRVSNSEEGVLASEYVKDLLKNTTTVYLQKDISDTDKYDRLLRYVWLEIPEDTHNINEISTKMLNGILLLDNVAEPVEYEPDTEYADDFEYISEL